MYAKKKPLYFLSGNKELYEFVARILKGTSIYCHESRLVGINEAIEFAEERNRGAPKTNSRTFITSFT